MESYPNLGGTSGVIAYEISNNSIIVQFKDGSAYLYTESSAGTDNFEKMKELAINGSGLNSFINKNVRKNYLEKIK